MRGADYVIWGLFAVALSVAIILSPERASYIRRHWLDVVLVVIPVFAPLRAARALRLLWAVGAAARALQGQHRLLVRRGTELLLLGAGVVVIAAAGLIVNVEQNDPNATIHSYGDGLWWAITTIATVGYGDKYPVTAAGHGLAVVLMLVGIAAFGVLTANLAALFVEEQEDESKIKLLQMDERLQRIESVLVHRSPDGSAMPLLRRRARKAAQARSRNLRRRKRRNQQTESSSEP